jgi:hypothetical protein
MMNRSDVSRWIERNGFLSMAAVMMFFGLLAGAAKMFLHSTEFLNRASLLCILASIAFACMAIAQDVFKKDPRRKQRKEGG